MLNFDSIEYLYLIEMYKHEIVWDKLMYVETSILDWSKLHMMRFHYEVIAKHFNNYNLIYSDTEGLACFLLSPGEFSPHVGCL